MNEVTCWWWRWRPLWEGRQGAGGRGSLTRVAVTGVVSDALNTTPDCLITTPTVPTPVGIVALRLVSDEGCGANCARAQPGSVGLHVLGAAQHTEKRQGRGHFVHVPQHATIAHAGPQKKRKKKEKKSKANATGWARRCRQDFKSADLSHVRCNPTQAKKAGDKAIVGQANEHQPQ